VGAPVQIRVYEDRLRIWNPGVLPDGWTVKTLVGAHASTPFNPAIANVFFRSGEIETWGRGIQRIFTACKESGTPRPSLTFDGTGLTLEFRYATEYLKAMATPPVAPPVTGQVTGEVAGEVTGEVTGEVSRLLQVLAGEVFSRTELQARLMLKSQANFRDRYLLPALAEGLVEHTIRDKPNSRLQKYRLTDKGRASLESLPKSSGNH